jgi:hypothetical protein
MAEQYRIQGIVLTIGDLKQITEKFSKCEVELQVGDERKTVDCPRWHRGKLAVNASYELLMERNDFGETIQDVVGSPSTRPSTQRPAPTAQQVVAPTPNGAAPVTPKPDFNGRWREWNMHARTAQMQATERVSQKIRLLEQGLLMNAKGEAYTKVRDVTLAEWTMEAIDLYWDELERRFPQDAYSTLVERDVKPEMSQQEKVADVDVEGVV